MRNIHFQGKKNDPFFNIPIENLSRQTKLPNILHQYFFIYIINLYVYMHQEVRKGHWKKLYLKNLDNTVEEIKKYASTF